MSGQKIDTWLQILRSRQPEDCAFVDETHGLRNNNIVVQSETMRYGTRRTHVVNPPIFGAPVVITPFGAGAGLQDRRLEAL